MNVDFIVDRFSKDIDEIKNDVKDIKKDMSQRKQFEAKLVGIAVGVAAIFTFIFNILYLFVRDK